MLQQESVRPAAACRASLYVDHGVGTHCEVLCFALGTKLLHKMVSCRRGKWCKHPCWHQPFLPSASGPRSSHRYHRAQTGEQHQTIRHGECQQPSPQPPKEDSQLFVHTEKAGWACLGAEVSLILLTPLHCCFQQQHLRPLGMSCCRLYCFFAHDFR